MKWEVIKNLSLPQLDNQDRVGGEDVSSVRQRYCSSHLGEVKECEQKSRTTAGGASSHSCCYSHTLPSWSVGDYERLKSSAFASVQSNDSSHATVEHRRKSSNPGQCSSFVMSPVNMGNPDYTYRTRIRDVIPHLEMNNPIRPSVLTLSYTQLVCQDKDLDHRLILIISSWAFFWRTII